MGPLRNAYLDALGIDRWVPRSAPPEVALPPPVESAPLPAAKRAGIPPAAPFVPLPPVSDWGVLRERVAGCTACAELCRTRTQTVFGVGNTRAEWLVIGEAPGAEEDRQGEPFVGRAGQLLNAMLLAIGLPRETVFIANILKCRPPGNRDPKPEEVSRCLPYLSNQIALLQPEDHPRGRPHRGAEPARDRCAARAPARQAAHLRRGEHAARHHLSPGLSTAHAVRQAQGLGGPQVRARDPCARSRRAVSA